MTNLAPPKDKPLKKAKPPEKERHWSEGLFHSGFFLGAVLFHLVIFLMVATRVIFPPYTPPTDEFTKTYVPHGAPPPPPPATTPPTVPVPTHNITPTAPVITANTSTPDFNLPIPDISSTTDPAKSQKVTPPPTKSVNGLSSRLTNIKSTVLGWGRDLNNILNSNGDTHNVVAKFPVYVAQYADGDWYCNLDVNDSGSITGGSMPNLVEKIVEWSHGNIKGSVLPTPLQIGGPDLLEKNPPFIFFTGHKDFVLTDKEIENLRHYLQNGGAIWGDNAFAGEGSRFDVAFRREMKRVVPDADKNFEPVALTHEIFTKSFFPMNKVPQGMNYYDEPLLHLDIDGKLAILYTPNDYSDLFCLHILPGDQQLDLVYPFKAPLHTNMEMWWKSDMFFRNFNLNSSLEAGHLGMNIIAFLLVRFDKDLLLTP